MNVEVHILTYNEEAILPYTLRHYATYATRIILHDSFSTDRTRDIAREAEVEVLDWPTDGINDKLAAYLKNNCWKGSKADWVITADADELIYFPKGARSTLLNYIRQGLPCVKPHGFELCSPVFPTTKGQLYEEVQMGARDDKWYGKPILFSPTKILETNFAMGAHSCRAQLVTHKWWKSGEQPQTEPPTYLLHCKHLGPIERVAREYNTDLQRLSEVNRRNGWGNQGDGHKHAVEKRMNILSHLQQVIPR